MSAEKETLQRVQNGLFHLQKGLTPFVEARMKGKHGEDWLHYASRAAGSSPNAKLDTYGLLKTIVDNWRDIFDDAFGRADKHKARNFTSMALEARNISQHTRRRLSRARTMRGGERREASITLMNSACAPAACQNRQASRRRSTVVMMHFPQHHSRPRWP